MALAPQFMSTKAKTAIFFIKRFPARRDIKTVSPASELAQPLDLPAV